MRLREVRRRLATNAMSAIFIDRAGDVVEVIAVEGTPHLRACGF
jgi:hypothetical protein